jgi:NADH:ubiquinone oxidoreductase subunit E
MGSSCFLKGAYAVLDALRQAAHARGTTDRVTIAGAFCKEHCRDGVSVEVDGVIHSVPDAARAAALFAELYRDETESA